MLVLTRMVLTDAASTLATLSEGLRSFADLYFLLSRGCDQGTLAMGWGSGTSSMWISLVCQYVVVLTRQTLRRLPVPHRPRCRAHGLRPHEQAWCCHRARAQRFQLRSRRPRLSVCGYLPRVCQRRLGRGIHHRRVRFSLKFVPYNIIGADARYVVGTLETGTT